MNKIQYIEALRAALSELSIEERHSAITFYSDYFDDAGVENEEATAQELGDVNRLAQIIKAGCGYMEPIPAKKEKKLDRKRNNLLLIGIILVVLFPVWGHALFAILGTIVSAVVALLAVAISGFVVGGILLVCGVAMIFVAIVNLVASPLGALLSFSASFLCVGLGLLFIGLNLWLVTKLLPALLRIVKALVNKLLPNWRKN